MKLIIANWKMNPETEFEAINLAKASDVSGLIIAPPFLFLEEVKHSLKNAKLAAQDLFWEKLGAYTGEVSAEELKSLGVEYVIVGHSERRALGETDEMVAKKVKAASDAGLIPVLCVGESAVERASGLTEEVVTRQLLSALELLKSLISNSLPFIVAYEPLWAIGSHNPATPQDVVKVLQCIRTLLKHLTLDLSPFVIYGGSVDALNAHDFLKEKEIDGLLVGGASLKPDQIIRIVEISSLF